MGNRSSRKLMWIALGLCTLFVQQTWAVLTVDSPIPISHRVSVQIIQTALDDGTEPATVFGNAVQQEAIETSIDVIWSQAGIDIEFLPTVVRYDDTFAYQGNNGDQVRPAGDLNRIIANAKSEGDIWHPDASVVNLFFVEVVPSFEPLESLTAAGRAQIGNNGIAQFVGSGLLGNQNFRDIAAKIVAHEIGHNLGLKHTADATANLMSPNGTTQQFTQQQMQAVLQTTMRSDSVAFIPNGGTGFPQLLLNLPGDYNGNGTVDAADYAVWRDSLGSTVDLAADGNNNHEIDAGDYDLWRSQWGNTLGAGSNVSLSSAINVPEPLTAMLVSQLLLLITGCNARRRTGSIIW